MLKLTHPVLYVFFDEQSKDTLRLLCNEKFQNTQSIAYLNIKSKDDLDFDTLVNINRRFLEKEYSRPFERRIYFIVDSNKKLLVSLSDAVLFIKSFFENINITPIIDIFALTDEAKLPNLNIQQAITNTYDELKFLATSNLCNMVYIISNLNSKGVLINDYMQFYQAIVLCSILKDCSKTGYDELNFLQNCEAKNKDGYFYTVGMKKISKPIEILSSVILKQIIDENSIIYEKSKDSNIVAEMLESFLKTIDEIFKAAEQKYSLNVNSLAINIEMQNRLFNCNGDALDACFGESYVDLYYEINYEKECGVIASKIVYEHCKTLKEAVYGCIENENVGFFAVKRMLYKLKSEHLPELKERIKEEIFNAESMLQTWQNEQPVITKGLKKVNAFGNALFFPFELAQFYIALKNDYFKCKAKLSALFQYETVLLEFINNFKNICEKLSFNCDKLNGFIKLSLSEKPTLIAENFEQYYSNKACMYIANNFKSYFKQLYKDFYKLGFENIEALYKECNAYISKLIGSDSFNLDIYSEIYERIKSNISTEFKTEESIARLLIEEIKEDKIYFSKLTSAANFFDSVCLITGDGQLVEKLSEKNTLGHLNVFFDLFLNLNNFNEGEQLDVVYFIGKFSIEQMHYSNLYKL